VEPLWSWISDSWRQQVWRCLYLCMRAYVWRGASRTITFNVLDAWPRPPVFSSRPLRRNEDFIPMDMAISARLVRGPRCDMMCTNSQEAQAHTHSLGDNWMWYITEAGIVLPPNHSPQRRRRSSAGMQSPPPSVVPGFCSKGNSMILILILVLIDFCARIFPRTS
jgi:hypothetical protein